MNTTPFLIIGLHSQPVQALTLHQATLAIAAHREQRGLSTPLERHGLTLSNAQEYYEIQPEITEASPYHNALKQLGSLLLQLSAKLSTLAAPERAQLGAQLDRLSDLWPRLSRPSTWPQDGQAMLPLLLGEGPVKTGSPQYLEHFIQAAALLLQPQARPIVSTGNKVWPIMTAPEH